MVITMREDNLYISQKRHNLVVKANELIQKSRFSLSVQQQKIVLYLISQISPDDDEFKLYDFNILEFCRVCGIDWRSGKHYTELKEAIKEVADKSMWIRLEKGGETLVRWIDKPYINDKSGIIQIKLDNDLKPYLLQLKSNFTQYELLWTLNFRSKYSIRLYELAKSIHYYDDEEYTKQYTLDELRKLLDAETYTTYQTFKSRVLLPAITEINNFSDKTLSFEPIKRGRGVAIILLTVSSKAASDKLKIEADIENKFELNQITLWDSI